MTSPHCWTSGTGPPAAPHSFLPAGFFDRERDDIRTKCLPVAETWVFEEGGRVVGFISLLGDVVGGIFVLPERHGRRIGRRLLDHVRASHDHLDVEVFKENAIGRAFYDACGFAVVGERVHQETGRPLLRMRLDG